MILNWNTDEARFKKENPERYKLWRLVQVINYGGEKIDKSEVIKNWDKIKNELDTDRRKTLEFLIWNKKWKAEPGLRADRSNYLDWLVRRNHIRISLRSNVVGNNG